MTLDACQALSTAWYHNRLSPDFHRRTADEAMAIFASLGLTGPFWSLDGNTATPQR